MLMLAMAAEKPEPPRQAKCRSRTGTGRAGESALSTQKAPKLLRCIRIVRSGMGRASAADEVAMPQDKRSLGLLEASSTALSSE